MTEKTSDRVNDYTGTVAINEENLIRRKPKVS